MSLTEAISYIRNLNYLKIFGIYLLIINFIGYMSMYLDKRKAQLNKPNRTPEKRLFLYALLFGSIGSIMGMYHFRHKTKHWYFTYGMPFILILQFILAGWIFYKF